MFRPNLRPDSFLALLPLLACLASCAGAEPPPPSVAAVLDQYAATQKALEHCEQVTDARTEVYVKADLYVQIRQRAEYRRDGGRAFLSDSDKRADPFKPMPAPLPPLPPPDATDLSFDSVSYSLSTADGSTSYMHYPQYEPNSQVILDIVDNEAERLQLLPNDLIGCWTRGWLFEDHHRLDDVLRSAGAAAR